MSGAQSISTRRASGVQRVCRVWHRARSSVYQANPGREGDRKAASALPRTTSWWPTFAGCSKPRRFMVRATEKPGRSRVADARARPPSPAARGPRAWAEGARWDHHHRGARRDVGHRHDGHRDRRRGGSRRLRGRRSLRDRVHRAPCRQARDPLRGPGADPPGHPRTLRGHRRGVARGLRLRHAHGSNDLADDFQQEVAFFGIESSPSFVREPEGNGVAERFIRTLKENLLWVRSFETIEELRLALLEFKRTDNEQWMLEKDDYRSPAQVRRDLLGLDAAA